MGQERNSGRQANLDEKKSRAAGRRNQKNPERQSIKDWQHEVPAKGKTSGAFGKDNKANRGDSGAIRGGTSARAKDSSVTTNRSSRPARKRGASKRARGAVASRHGK
jgi:hypothetical protein